MDNPLELVPHFASTFTIACLLLPLLVVIKITPLAPRAPYKALDAASFKTVVLSISAVFIEDISPSKGTPSTTYKGELPAAIDPTPLIRTVDVVPGCPFVLVTCTPATWPDNALVTLATCLLEIASLSITEAEPVNEDLFAVPYATTITSSSN